MFVKVSQIQNYNSYKRPVENEFYFLRLFPSYLRSQIVILVE